MEEAWVIRKRLILALFLVLIAVTLAACEGYTTSGTRTSTHQTLRGGDVHVRIKKANGSATQDMEVNAFSGTVLSADVTLSVEKGSFKIELLGEGDEDNVTLVLEARDGQSVSGHGVMVVDAFDEASYRVTAVEAENVEYTLEYVFDND